MLPQPHPRLDIRPSLKTDWSMWADLIPKCLMRHKGFRGYPSLPVTLEAHFRDGHLPDSFPSGTGFGARLDLRPRLDKNRQSEVSPNYPPLGPGAHSIPFPV